MKLFRESRAQPFVVTFTEFNELIIIKPIVKEGKVEYPPGNGWYRFLNHGRIIGL